MRQDLPGPAAGRAGAGPGTPESPPTSPPPSPGAPGLTDGGGTRPCAQGVGDGEYQPTSGVRVQKVEHTFRSAKVKVELWDCAGGADTKK